MIQQMIREEQHSSRELYIPEQDLDAGATTQMSPEAAQVIEDSQLPKILHMFNRDYLYGQGRFDEYKDGLILKWGDGYSRKHIWATVENGNLVFETSHVKKCGKPYCTGTHHVLTRDLYTNWDVINQELVISSAGQYKNFPKIRVHRHGNTHSCTGERSVLLSKDT